jgi:hypothetical protein
VSAQVGKPAATSEESHVMSSFEQSRAVERSLHTSAVDQNSHR